MLSLNEIKKAVNKVSGAYQIKKAALFGSYADGTANEKSDVDILVEFKKPAVSLFVLTGLKNDMETELKKKVDMIHGPLKKDSLLKPGRVVNTYER